MANRSFKRGGARRPASLRDSRRVSASRSSQGNVREAASWVLERTLQASSPADSFLEGARERCDPRDHGLLYELVRGSLTWLRRIDWVLEQASARPLAKIEPPLVNLMRLGIYQLLFLDRVPVHAVVNEAVEQAHRATHRGGAAFVNGVLRSVARARRLEDWPVIGLNEVGRLGIEHSHPDLLVARWIDRFGLETTIGLLEANNRQKPLQVLAFREFGGRELLAENLIERGVEVSATDLAPLGLRMSSGVGGSALLDRDLLALGRYYVQDEASQVAALVPPPGPGEHILDLAAAPGGKVYAARAFEPSSRHVVSDLSLTRLLLFRDNDRRLGFKHPSVVADAGRPPFAMVFDRVVVDAPCSGTGTLRKNPELKWRISLEEIERLSMEGLSLLRGAASGVGSGGRLIWITCSLEFEENEGVVERFLETDQGGAFEPEDLSASLPVCLHSGLIGGGGWRLLTAGDHDGFSVHVLRRRAGDSN